jgi:hypothetical protein
MRLYAWIVLFLSGCSCADAAHQAEDGGPTDAGHDASDASDASDPTCTEGEERCDPDREVIQRCQPGGHGWDDVETCTEDFPICARRDGDFQCIDQCDPDPVRPPSYQGCDYFAVDLEQIDETSGTYNPRTADFAVVVSNTSDRHEAHVQVYTGDAAGEAPRGAEVTVGPNDLAVLNLGQRNVEGTGQTFSAFRIRSDYPVSAYQFNPIDTPEAFSNDASLLLPTTTVGTRYYAVTGDGITALDNINVPGVYSEWPPTVTIVGIQDAPTNVTVYPANPITPGGGISGNPIALTLARYEVANLSAEMLGGDPGPAGDGNLTGTYVEADAPVVVFSGNPATVVPHGAAGVCCADHVEEQLWPVEIWGTRFVVPRSPPRTDEDDWIVVVASEDATTFDWYPAAPPGAPTLLGAGETASFAADADLVVVASAPILVTQLLASSSEASYACDPLDAGSIDECRDLTGYEASRCNSIAPGSSEGRCEQIGDPSLVQVPPTAQYRSDYVFLVPEGSAHDYIVVAGHAGTKLELDAAAIDEVPVAIAEVGADRFVRWRIEVLPGSHTLVAVGAQVGAIVYGYDADVSYAFPAGLDLEQAPIE